MKDDSNDILSYFHHYHSLDSEDNKKKFATSLRAGGIFPEREKWNSFIYKNWEKWKIHNCIVQVLQQHHIHPIPILMDKGSLEDWPNADLYLPLAIDAITKSLLGIKPFGGKNLLLMSLRKPITIFTHCSRVRICGQVEADKGCLVEFRADVLKAFEGTFSFDLLNNSH